MPDADPIADLAIRRRQLETHLLQSHEYREKVGGRLKLLAIIKLGALIVVLGEALIYARAPKTASTVVVAAMGVTLFVLLASGAFLWRTWLSLSRLNESWLTPEAKRTLEGLRQEQAQAKASIS